jgi:hypothetical protein
VKLEAWAVGITAGSREVSGRKGLWQEKIIQIILILILLLIIISGRASKLTTHDIQNPGQRRRYGACPSACLCWVRISAKAGYLLKKKNLPDGLWGPHSLLFNGISIFSGVKRPGRVDDHPTSKPKAKNECGYTYNHPYTFDVQRNTCMCCKLPLELVHNQDTRGGNNTNKITFILIYFNYFNK